MTTKMSQGEHARLRDPGKKTEEKIEKITPEKIARRRARADKPFYPRGIHFNKQASKDGIRHFVDGIGDLNPMFRDEAYAKQTKYGRIIAPGCYLYTIWWTLIGGGLPGAHGWYSGAEWEWYRPIFAGDEFKTVGVIRELVEKKGRMTGGGSIFLDYCEIIHINQRGEIVGKDRYHAVRADRSQSGSAGKERRQDRPAYTKEDWKRILDAYDDEIVRGAETRYWEDVEVGEVLQPMIKGPLSVRDEIAWLMGGGSPFMQAHKIQYLWEARHPRGLEYVAETDEWDIPEMVHVFDSFARAIGVERAYDYGNQRLSWLCQFFTNWMGDDGFLWKMNGDLRAFNQVGDITTFNGKVVKKYVAGDKYCVDIEAWAKNQYDVYSIKPDVSTIILPSRENGPVVYPNPTPKLMQEVSNARPLDELIAEGLI